MFFKTTHIATKAEVQLKVTIEYKINSEQRKLLRSITKQIIDIKGNEFDVAIYFMLGQLDALSVTEDTKDFVSKKCFLLGYLYESCKLDVEEYCYKADEIRVL